MKIVVFSCDKNTDTFLPFHHCIEKYYPDHPEIIYLTETVVNPYYKTICKNYPLNCWTRRIRESLKEINDDIVLFIVDDAFIRKEVDVKRIEEAQKVLHGNAAMVNFEKSFDKNDLATNYPFIKKRNKGACYELSLLVGLWQKDKLINILNKDSDPWTVELRQNTLGYDYYINSGDYIIDWGYETWKPAGIFKGKWCREIIDFFNKEGLDVDYTTRGFTDEN